MPIKNISVLVFFFVCQVSLFSNDTVFVVANIHVVGNQKTKTEVVLREVTFNVGDTLSAIKLNRAIKESENNLLNTSLFNFVTILKIVDDQRVEINILLEERWYLWPYPIFEYADRNFNIWLKNEEYDRLNYGIHLIKYNFRGRREVLNFKVRLGFREQFLFYYENPYLDMNKKFGLFFGLAKYRQAELPVVIDSNIVRFYEDDKYAHHEFIADVGFQYRNKYFLSHYFNIGYISSSIADTIAIINENYFGDAKTQIELMRFSYTFDLDKRDSKIYPLEGNRYFAQIRQTGVGILDNFNNSFTELGIGLQTNNLLYTKTYSTLTLKGKSNFGNDPAFFLNSGVGYSDLLRGYEFYVIQGDNHAVFSGDVKYNFLPKTVHKLTFIPAEKFNKTYLIGFLNVFFDVAYVDAVTSYKNDYMSNEIQYSAGIGVDFVTYYDKILRINYSINKYKEKNLYLHFNIPF